MCFGGVGQDLPPTACTHSAGFDIRPNKFDVIIGDHSFGTLCNVGIDGIGIIFLLLGMRISSYPTHNYTSSLSTLLSSKFCPRGREKVIGCSTPAPE